MKNLKKIGAIALAMVLALALALCVPAFASGATGEQFTITINKDGKAVSFAGQTFKAYKIFNVTYSGDNYSYTPIDAFNGLVFEGKSGQDLIDYLGTLTGTPTKMSEFTAEAVKFVSNASNNINPTVVKDDIVNDADSIKIGVPDAGYYLVIGTVKGATDTSEKPETVFTCGLNTTHPDAVVNVKTEVPTLDKKIVVEAANGTETKMETNTASVGDKVNFKVETKVPNMNGYKEYFYVVTDTMSKGLTFNNDVVVKMGTDTIDAGEYTAETDPATPVEGQPTTIKIYFKNFIQYLDKNGEDIVITYSATVNKYAEIGTNPNTNTAILDYTNDPTKDLNGDPDTGKPDPKDPHGTTPESTTKTFVTAIELLKYGGDDKDNVLAGATFELTGKSVNMVEVTKDTFTVDNDNGTYWKLKDGKYTTDDPRAEGMDQTKYDDIDTKYVKSSTTEWQTKTETVTVTGTTNDDGLLKFTGLGEGEYTLTEIVAPDGYNKLEHPIILNVKYENGEWTVTGEYNGTVLEGENAPSIVGGVVKYDVQNKSGSLLPSTGGIGTTIFYVAGGVLVLGAVILLVTRKRVNGEV